MGRPKAENYSNWSGFIPQDGAHTNVRRTEVLDELIANYLKNPNANWRQYVGQVLICLMGKVEPEKLCIALAKAGYMNNRAFAAAMSRCGVKKNEAATKFEGLMGAPK